MTLAPRRATRLVPAALILLLTVALLLPAFLAPAMTHDSFWIDRTWSEQFTMLLRSGNPYPRWLPWSYGGLGAPVFYYYAPLSFHLAGLIGLTGIATYPALLLAFGCAWFGSGLAMHAWLKDRAAAPLAGALLYMVLPYHVIDFYGRGALAEFCAFAIIPLVAIGICHAADRGRSWPLAIAYTALIMTHLPTAVIASVLLVAPLALWSAQGDIRRLLPVATGLATGLAGAAIYLVPALTLQHHVALGSLWDVPFLQPANWSLLHPARWTSTSYVLLFDGLALATAATALLLSGRRPGFWTIWTVAIAAIAAGLLPGFWSLPVLKAVQFPWRALALAEFGLATVAAGRRGSPVTTVAILLPLLAFALTMLSPANPLHGDAMTPLPIPGRQDVIEYLPAGAVAMGRAPRTHLLQAATATARRHPGAMFSYPSVQARCDDGSSSPPRRDRDSALLVRAPADCRLEIGRLPQEWLGLFISLAGWGAVAASAYRPSPRRLSARACPAWSAGSPAVP
ncbi:glycosyltransferase family protein [Sphingomonas nostoxanthinifaciens]|uniref:hypothetical protein n=1 Tax=Sphingomonas nostoxanthinifaciens TaxID=2872652 RepID=UPI001CC20D52|nr:hypothetical protein [Sphingomonas nostoxanthinifaciens]UAK23423.1 hypothetical protein K8P63_13590 [Sphingomonas nostoxanthinifaciens]